MKNHFFFSYAGNKRQEVELIYKNIKNKIEDLIKNNSDVCIIEPFCGTSAFSYYLSTLYPKKFKYILNDNNHHLIQLYKISKNPDDLKILEEKINKLVKDDLTKEKYNKIISQDSFESWFIKNKIYDLRPGLYRLNYKYKYINLQEIPIVNFLQTETVELCIKDAIEIIEENKDNESNIIFLDPPYVNSCNTFYKCPTVNIYEYIHKNNLIDNKAFFIIVLEKIWIINLLFDKYYKIEYDKKYATSKKKTTHLMILNNIDNL